MTREEACRILGVAPGTDPKEIKKKYRQLMHRLHPDAAPSVRDVHLAWQVNIAYDLLKQTPSDALRSSSHAKDADTSGRKAGPEKAGRQKAWDAPVNPHAFREREILCYAEGQDGEILGTFSVARGNYFWTTEEDFPLFLRSIYNCGKELLDEADASLGRASAPACRHKIHAELTYLLAQQYISAAPLLKELSRKVIRTKEGQEVFCFLAMLETEGRAVSLAAEAPLYPGRLKDHRLYLTDSAGRETGYLSFSDDRLYYVIVPLFEQRRVLVRIRAAGDASPSAKKKSAGYRRLHLWLKLKKEEEDTHLPESLHLQISRLLDTYRSYRS